MAENNLITRKINDVPVFQRPEDGYLSATTMCKAVEKEVKHYKENKQTQEFLVELSSDMGIPISELIQTVRGRRRQQGTWVHPKVAIHLAQWLSPKFAVQVTNWVHDWMLKKQNPGQPSEQTPLALPAPEPQAVTTVTTIIPGKPPQAATVQGRVVIVPLDEYVECVTALDRLLHVNLLEAKRLADRVIGAGVMTVGMP